MFYEWNMHQYTKGNHSSKTVHGMWVISIRWIHRMDRWIKKKFNAFSRFLFIPIINKYQIIERIIYTQSTIADISVGNYL